VYIALLIVVNVIIKRLLFNIIYTTVIGFNHFLQNPVYNYIYLNMRKKTAFNPHREKVESWLINKRKYLRVLVVEEDLEFPYDGINKFLRGTRKLKNEEIDKLHDFIKELFLSYDEDYDIDT